MSPSLSIRRTPELIRDPGVAVWSFQMSDEHNKGYDRYTYSLAIPIDIHGLELDPFGLQCAQNR